MQYERLRLEVGGLSINRGNGGLLAGVASSRSMDERRSPSWARGPPDDAFAATEAGDSSSYKPFDADLKRHPHWQGIASSQETVVANVRSLVAPMSCLSSRAMNHGASLLLRREVALSTSVSSE